VSDGTKKISRAEAERCEAQEHNPTLASMLAKGLPLCRDTYIAMSWGADEPSPDDWNAEHEAEVPECFRRPLPHRGYGKKGASVSPAVGRRFHHAGELHWPELGHRVPDEAWTPRSKCVAERHFSDASRTHFVAGSAGAVVASGTTRPCHRSLARRERVAARARSRCQTQLP
jgi:hypothetical protein